MVGVTLFVFVKTCNYAILLLNIGSSWTKSVLYSVFYSVHNLWEAVRNMFPQYDNNIQVADNFSKHVVPYTCCLPESQAQTSMLSKQLDYGTRLWNKHW